MIEGEFIFYIKIFFSWNPVFDSILWHEYYLTVLNQL